jgi:DNA-binding PadR family transcriptional regulator
MRYSLYINQPVALDLGMENTTEAILFDYLIIAPTWADDIIIDGKVYYWVARHKICEAHPLLDLKPDTVYRYLKKLRDKGLIEYKKDGKKDCIRITPLGKKYVTKSMSEKNPSFDDFTMSEKNPKKLGKKSEFARKKIRHINILKDSTIKDSLSKRDDFLKSQESFVNYIRGTYPNQVIALTTDKYTNKEMQISVSEKGRLYDKFSGETFSGTRAMEIWTALYELAKKGQLPILNKQKEVINQ